MLRQRSLSLSKGRFLSLGFDKLSQRFLSLS